MHGRKAFGKRGSGQSLLGALYPKKLTSCVRGLAADAPSAAWEQMYESVLGYGGCCGELSALAVIDGSAAWLTLTQSPRKRRSRPSPGWPFGQFDHALVGERDGFLSAIYGCQRPRIGLARGNHDRSEFTSHPDFAIFSPGESETRRV